ncbi:MAG TPA: SCO family protein, partial [Candidatus Xenobia bacterium]
LKGKVWVADFIFTRCPDACWNMTQTLVGMQDLLHHHDDLRFVSFSIDPAFDTPPVLTRYGKLAKVTSAHWWFLTGPMTEITRVAHSFLLATLTPDDDILSHSTEFALVDRDGVIRGYYDLDVPSDIPEMRQAIEKLTR